MTYATFRHYLFLAPEEQRVKASEEKSNGLFFKPADLDTWKAGYEARKAKKGAGRPRFKHPTTTE